MRIPLIELDLRMSMNRLNFDRVLFLDIDGVLHPDGKGEYEDFCCLPAVCDVLRSADPMGKLPIVVTSAWRHTQRLDAIKSNFPEDISQQIVGVTPDWLEQNAASLSADSAHGGKPARSHRRQDEIATWISRNAPGGRWLAVDDRAGGFEDRCPHLFLVPGATEDGGGQGITAPVAIDLQQRLNSFLALFQE